MFLKVLNSNVFYSSDIPANSSAKMLVKLSPNVSYPCYCFCLFLHEMLCKISNAKS